MRGILATFVASLSLLIVSDVQAQPNLPTLPRPRLQSIFPAGAQVGSTVEVTLTGTDIEDPEDLFFSHPGIKAEPIAPPPPADGKPPEPPPMPTSRRRGNRPAPLGVTRFKITVAADVPPGLHDVRLINKWGISNPRPFAVGTMEERSEVEPNNDVPQAQAVPLNSVVNGMINQPTDVDYFQVTASKGQRVLLHVAASSIDSRARPAVEVYDTDGRRLAFQRRYRDADALADLTWPHDGPCFVRVFQFTHNSGNTDHYYRLTVTTGPWIDAVFPPMIEPGQSASITLFGRNLPGGTLDPGAIEEGRPLEKLVVQVSAPNDPAGRYRLATQDHIPAARGLLDGFEYRLTGSSGPSNPAWLLWAEAPVRLEQEPNDQPDQATPIPLPADVAGRVDRPLDRDFYSITAKKGETWTIKLFGERIGATADFYVTVRPADPKANPLAEQDDPRELLHPFQFFNRTADPSPLTFTAPADGNYWIVVGARDSATEYGPRQLYRLTITPPQPDFRLVVMPSSPMRPEAGVLHAGGELALDVFLDRRDGMNAPVDLSVDGLPAGVTCPPQRLAPNQRHAVLVLSAAADAPPDEAVLTVKGTAMIGGQPVTREARPATIVWAGQAPQQPVLSRMDRQLVIAIRDKPPFRLTVQPAELTIKQGDKANLQIQIERIWPEFKVPVQVNVVPGPQPNQPLYPGTQFNGNNQPFTIPPDKNDGSVTLNIANNAPLGTYSYVVRGEAQYPFEKVKGQKVNTAIQAPALPITLNIIPATLANVTVSIADVKVGTAGELTVKVARQAGFTGEYQVKVVVPENAKGVTVPEGKIAADQSETKLPVMVAADAMPGEIANVVVQVTGLYEGKTPIVSEAKITLKLVP
ncbi:MAG: hypothetical protein N2039_02530 [Gemmataceae bacterium]|nr:hypothetical protein [Gemmataceae bacterium]